MGAVNVGIGHDDDLVIPQFGLIKFVADSAAKGGNHVFNFVRIENSVSLAFSTLRILPLRGRMACLILSRPCFALPPAESPSTKKISDLAGSFF